MSYSPLTSYRKISPNKNSPRTHKIDTITIHCYVGQVQVESMGNWFGQSRSQCSANYGIGEDGRIGCFVEEGDRSWCSSNKANDHRAITIECASDKTSPYAINANVYKSLVKLCTDICKRNGIKKLVWSTDKNSRISHKNGCNMTVHRDYANKSCPGEYIYSRLGKIAEEVNQNLGVKEATATKFEPYKVRIGIDDLRIRTTPEVRTGNFSGKYTGKGVFTIVEVKMGAGSTKGWGLLKSYERKRNGWISLDYAEKV